MQIRAIGFGDDSEPATVTVTMTVVEAATLTKLLGKIVPTSDEAHDLYDGFSHLLFNPYWDNGVDDVATPLDGLFPERIELKKE